MTVKNHHPNSVRHLTPSRAWTIHIDETGNQFGKDSIKSHEQEMTGKIVALVIAQGVQLETLPADFHAVNYQNKNHPDYNPQKLDEIINAIYEYRSKIGVLGIQYNDSLSKSSPNWWSGVVTLIKLVLRLLPIKAPTNGENNSVKIFIEQRDFKSHINLEAFCDDLLTDLKSIDPERFAHFGLKIQFTKKEDDKYNGYVDTIAHCWGGGKDAQQRRKAAQFSGHCFLNIQDSHAIERLYAIIDDPKKQLNARDWYEMMLVIADEPEYSLMRDHLTTIAEKCKKDDQLWSSYLYEVQSRLRYKDYQPKQLVEILNWLDNAKPTKATLPPMLKLQFLSAKLASQNHTGKADMAQIQEILELGNALIEEDAQQVAHAYIRVATACANAFKFEQMKKVLSQEIMQNKLAIGLSNYTKILSSLGQYYCFTHQPEQAIEYFKQAIEGFEKLSDKEQSQKDILQTQTYLMLAYLQSNQPARKHLQILFQVKSLIECVETYAKNENDKVLNLKNSDKNYVFKHQVILRMLNQGHFDDLKESYLEHQEKWITGEGHPWQSISFWRGMLLAEKGEKEQAQKQFNHIFNEIKVAEVEDVTLIWIYLVYSVAIRQLGFEFQDISKICYPMVKERLNIQDYDKLAELRNTTDFNDIRQLVLQCLPFNYA